MIDKSNKQSADQKSKKETPARKRMIKVKKLDNTSDLTGRVGGQAIAPDQVVVNKPSGRANCVPTVTCG
ncbi:hypothetical protein BH10CYA1_BH10CYA1_04030 [soil metagenome]